MIKIAIDVMGGDFAPQEIVKGAVDGAREHNSGIILVGRQGTIQNELHKYDISGLDIEIVHTDEFIAEGERPAFAMCRKRNSSVILCSKMVRDGKADAAVSAGSTGAILTSAVHILGTFEGISRPVIGGPFLGFAPDTILIDIGSNVDSPSKQLLDFAMLGTVYTRRFMGITEPTIALVSNGAEEGKGNKVVKEAYDMLKKSGLNFKGNIEGNDIVNGKANVVICDGFTGNVVTKFCEGLNDTIAVWLDNELKNKLTEDEVHKIIASLKCKLRASDAAGGWPLWGVNGIICKAHGHSNAQNISNTIGTARQSVENDLAGALKKGLADLRSYLNITTQHGS
jgi:glycerol-3-phosphate acyltransferase PlsX